MSKAGLTKTGNDLVKICCSLFVSRVICGIISRFRWLVAREEVVGDRKILSYNEMLGRKRRLIWMPGLVRFCELI